MEARIRAPSPDRGQGARTPVTSLAGREQDSPSYARGFPCYRFAMRFALRSLLVVLPAAALTIACAEHLPDQDLRILDAPAMAKTSPEALWKEYRADKAAAGRAYHGKSIDVTGKVSAIIQDAVNPRILFSV